MNETRLFLAVAIGSGLETGMMSPDDVIEYVDMEVLAHHLPIDLKTQLLTACLQSETMNAELVLDTLGVDALAENAPMEVLWEVVATVARRELGTAKPQKPTLPPPSVLEGPERKPNRSSRIGRARAGATSRAARSPATENVVPTIEDESPFDVDTRVGEDLSEFDVSDELNAFGNQHENDELTAHGEE